MQSYFSILQKEMSIVYKKEGVGKALFTTSFLTDFIPGVVMSFLFGQLMLLAAPIKLSSGYSDGSYSKKTLETQKETLIIFEKQSRKIKEWKEMDQSIGPVTNLVPGLTVVAVPSLGCLTPILQKIAIVFPDTKLLRISNHKEVQVKVSTKNIDTTKEENCENVEKQLKEQLLRLYGDGVKVMFHFQLPTVGGSPPEICNPLFISLCVKVEHLLDLIRTIHQIDMLKIDQIYDFWG